jgi:hypothetical protein
VSLSEIKLVDTLKDVGTAAAALAAVAYATGYLALRARARALGTDPNLGLVEEAYVFAGFRFLLTLLIAVLLTLPVIALFRAAALWLMRTIPLPAQEALQWLGLVILALVVLFEFRVLGVGHVLLESDSTRSSPFLADAVLGRNALGVWLVLGTAALTALSVLWFNQAPRGALSAFGVALGLVTLLQLLLLPVYQGMFYADQSVRVLDEVPPKASVLLGPVGIVDRGGESVTLLGANREGKRRLVTISKKDIEGLAITRVTTLRTFIDSLGKRAGVALLVPAALTAAAYTEAQAAQPPLKGEARYTMDAKASGDSYWRIVVDYLKSTFEYVGALGEGRAETGQVWIAELNGGRSKAAARPLGSFTGLSWPVFGPGADVYALEDRQIVRVDRDGQKTVLANSRAAWIKLVGVNADGSVLGLAGEPPFGRIAIWQPDGRLTLGAPPATAEERKRQAVLMQESRAYRDGRSLVLRYSQRGRGLDVFLEAPGAAAVNLSDCGDDACGQPSLSPDGSRVAWIRSAT